MAKKKKLSDKRKLREFFQRFLENKRTAQPTCRHFGECGGCEFQDIPYPVQLDAKKAAFSFILSEVMADWREKADGLEDAGSAEFLRTNADRLDAALSAFVPDIVASPRELGYRQRMDYVYAFGKAGLRRASRHRQVVELEECPLLGDEGFGVFQKAKAAAQAAGLESYDYMRHTGQLRYFVVRRSRNGQNLLSLVTKNRDAEHQVLAILRSMADAGDIASGHWLLAEGLGDVSFGEPAGTVGSPWISEDMNGLTLRIGPNTFFQSNPAVAEKAYAAIRDFCPPGGEVLDMYSGVGSIAVSVAPRAGRVTAVENSPENVALAEVNIRENGVNSLQLLVGDSSEYLRELAADPTRPRPDLLIVNPPRPGVEGDGMQAIKNLAPARLAYLSCNPFTLLRNLAEVLDEYAVHSLVLYDMFPQTRHFESLAFLERKDAGNAR